MSRPPRGAQDKYPLHCTSPGDFLHQSMSAPENTTLSSRTNLSHYSHSEKTEAPPLGLISLGQGSETPDTKHQRTLLDVGEALSTNSESISVLMTLAM